MSESGSSAGFSLAIFAAKCRDSIELNDNGNTIVATCGTGDSTGVASTIAVIEYIFFSRPQWSCL